MQMAQWEEQLGPGLLSVDKSAPPSLAMLKTLAIFCSEAGLQPRNMSGAFKFLEEAGKLTESQRLKFHTVSKQ